MHAGLHGGAKRSEHNANKQTKSRRSRSVLSRFRRKSTKVRRINVHEMNGNVKSSRKKSAHDRKVSVLDPQLYAGTGALLGSIASLSASEKTERMMRNGEISDVVKDHDFQFENLVFEGGGNKGMAYVGALQVKFSKYCSHRVKAFELLCRCAKLNANLVLNAWQLRVWTCLL